MTQIITNMMWLRDINGWQYNYYVNVVNNIINNSDFTYLKLEVKMKKKSCCLEKLSQKYDQRLLTTSLGLR